MVLSLGLGLAGCATSFSPERVRSEIAAQTGLPLGTVKSRLRLAFTRLRRALESEGVTDSR